MSNMSMTEIRKRVRNTVAEMNSFVKEKGIPAVVADNHVMASLQGYILYKDMFLDLTMLDDPAAAHAAVCVGGRGERYLSSADIEEMNDFLRARYGGTAMFMAKDDQWKLVKSVEREGNLLAAEMDDCIDEAFSILDISEQIIPGEFPGAWEEFRKAWASGRTKRFEVRRDAYWEPWGDAEGYYIGMETASKDSQILRFTNEQHRAIETEVWDDSDLGTLISSVMYDQEEEPEEVDICSQQLVSSAKDGVRFILDKGIPVFRLEKKDELNYDVLISDWYLYKSGNIDGIDWMYISCDYDGAVRFFDDGRQMIACLEPAAEATRRSNYVEYNVKYDLHMDEDFMYLAPVICSFPYCKWAREDEDEAVDIAYYRRAFEDANNRGFKMIIGEGRHDHDLG